MSSLAEAQTKEPTAEHMPACGVARGLTRPALLAATALLMAACSTSDVLPPNADPVGLVEPGEDGLPADAGIVEWDDDFHRVVVTTRSHPLPDALRAGDDQVEDETGVRVAPDVATVPGDGSVRSAVDWAALVDLADASLGAPSPSLRPVPPADDTERELLRIAPSGSFVVVDDDGLHGPPGQRHLRSLTELFDLDRLSQALSEFNRVDAVAVDVVAASDGTAESSATPVRDPAAGDDAVLSEILLLDGVIEAMTIGDGLVAVTLDEPRSAGALSEVDGVVTVTVDGLLAFGGDERQGEQWMIENTGSGAQAGGWPGVADADTSADAAWEVATGDGIVVAVIDSGVDTSHPDLASRIWTNRGEICGNGLDDDANGFVDDCRGWDFGSNDAGPNPDPGAPMTFHGTHVAGLVAAERNGTGVVGIAPDASIMALKVSDAAGRISTSWVAAAIQ
ncbi:MAG: S8 family serine peptidase, partial [Actinomycetota bacterium]